MIDCTIAGISQEVDFGENVTLTYLRLVLPSGKTFRAAIDEDAAALVLGAHVHTQGMPRSVVRVSPTETAAPLSPASQEEQVEESGMPSAVDNYDVHVFGGEVSSREAASEEVREPSPEEEPEVEEPEEPEENVTSSAPAKPLKKGKLSGHLSAPFRTVPRDSMGYPVLPGRVDVDELTPKNNRDEDGVGSL